MIDATADALLFELSPSDFDAYPRGIIVLNRDGTILEYNRAEAKLSHREGLQTVGLNFWTDVAPCTAIAEFKGRFDDFAAEDGDAIERFDFAFKFPWGFLHVGIAMVRKMGQAQIILLVTVKNTVTS